MPKWFPGRKGFSNSVILFGYGASASIFDQIQTLYINPKNYSPDKPYSKDFPNEKYFSKLHIDLLEKVPYIFLIMTSICALMQIMGLFLLSDYDRYRQNASINDDEEIIVPELSDNLEDKNSLGVNYQSPDDGLNASQAIRTPVFYILTIIISTITIPATIVITFYKVQFYLAIFKFFISKII